MSTAYLSRAQADPPVAEISFFVTSIGSASRSTDPYVGGNFGGLAGADEFCTELAEAAGITGKVWRAYLTTSTVNARDRIGAGPWHNAQGQLIANNVTELHANGIPAALVMDELGNAIPSSEHDIVTGGGADGRDHPAQANCGDFTSSHPDIFTHVGHSDGGGVGQSDPFGSPVSVSWNSAHISQCSEAGMASAGGAGRLYAFALTEHEAWRLFYFGSHVNSGNGADDADPDGDGQDNQFEFTAGLSPIDPLSRFRLRVAPVAGEPQQKAIIFSRLIAGRSYVVESKASFMDPTWNPLTSFTTANSGDERTVTDLSATGTQKFYHVEITRP